MLWFEITARVPPADAEGVADLVREVAPGGVTVEEPITILGPEMGFRVRPGEPVLVRAYLPSSELGAVLAEQLRREMQQRFPSVELTARPIYDEDWAVSWREFFGPVDYGGRIVVVPTWVDHPLEEGRIAIRLDPGQAFGTGHHETTRLCLAALETYIRPGWSVLDVGTGSGILSIAAVKLGAANCVAIDVDPIAVRVAGENCAANGVAGIIELRQGKLRPQPGERFDLVVANISTPANLELLPVFPQVLAADGVLLLSGILEADAEQFRGEAPGCGLAFLEARVENDWCLLAFGRG